VCGFVVSLKKVLIANRSEVALRVLATCKARGIETVAIYTKEDRYSSFVYKADYAYQLTQSGYRGYLDQDEIISIALRSGADGLHPGYGFLSENSDFAQKIIDAGFVWIGPRPEAIALMGDKVIARKLMGRAGVPIVPGISLEDLTDAGKESARQKAIDIGFPVILKDPKSGGGKGMRKIQSIDEFDQCWDAVISESRKLTGSTVLLLEKYLSKSRHIEVQIAGDGQSYVHFFERECSIQRRHQKIIEEAPCQFISDNTKQVLYDAARTCARSVKYGSIGTVEFLVTPEEDVYFLEMNTRLQVEHGVTEMITGLDLVGLQFDLADSGILLKQAAITQQGHAIQCRIYAENPAKNFTPATGVIKHVYFPEAPFIRLEYDLDEEKEVTPFFDPMLGKVLTCAATRNKATQQMLALLSQSKLEGVTTNINFLHAVIASPEFASGAFHTQLISHTTFVATLMSKKNKPSDDDCMLAGLAVLLAGHEQEKQVAPLNYLDKPIQRQWKDQQWR